LATALAGPFGATAKFRCKADDGNMSESFLYVACELHNDSGLKTAKWLDDHAGSI
jgi:hypothetical protein